MPATGGTSPRMRGKPIDDKEHDIELGNIPAYAGKTDWLSASTLSKKEHPRVCGENLH